MTLCFNVSQYCLQNTKTTSQISSALGGAHLPPTKVFQWLTASVNKTIVKPCVAAAVGGKTILKPQIAAATNTYTSDFPDIKSRVAWLIRQQRKQSGSRIRTIIRIGLKS